MGKTVTYSIPVPQIEPPKLPSSFGRYFKIAAIIVTVCAALLGMSAWFTQKLYHEKILPGVFLGGKDIGGMTPEAATEVITQAWSAMLESGLTINYEGKQTEIALTTRGATDPDLIYELMSLNIAEEIAVAKTTGRTSYFHPLLHVLGKKNQLIPHIELAQTRLKEAIIQALPGAQDAGTPTDFVITFANPQQAHTATSTVKTIEVVDAVPGFDIDFDTAFFLVSSDAQDFSLNTLAITRIARSAQITRAEAETLIPQVESALINAPFTLTFTHEGGEKKTFPISGRDLSIWLKPEKINGVIALSIDTQDISRLLNEIHTAIDVNAQNAKFIIEGQRVTEFHPAQDGLRVDDDDLVGALLAAIAKSEPEQQVPIPVDRTSPEIKNESANTYGIKEILGVGVSNFATSPKNRRANIAHGTEKLNGTLIPPGEILSLVEHLKPFTLEDGYLAELVIKGDEIVPEIGGGLCQIGTTTFRAAMNSGLEIVERHNHSLVVSYYNDPSNGNPGTDATIYDPNPDLKIKNNTDHYIMLQTQYDDTQNELRFTFWGTADGRKGSYTPPQVLDWTGYGDAINKETDTMLVGEKSCQAAHPGASTTFDYNVVYADGTMFTQTFTSTYRSLPQICLIGTGSAAAPPPTEPVPTIEP